MRSPAAAIAWEFGRRNRWGLIAVGGSLLLIITVKLLILGPAQRVNFEDAETFAFFVLVPLTAAFLYFLAVFTFGFAGDMAARQSMYPARMFTLPVTTNALAGWPMLYGTVAMAVLWLATRAIAVWPSGVDVPWIWPALLAMSLLAWTQALTWMPYPLPGMRVIVIVLWLTVIDGIVLVAVELKATEGLMLAIVAPQVPLAYLAARFALARARRGDVPDWRVQIADRARRRGEFRSAARAQTWFEWRRYGRSLPALVGMVLPFELGLLFVFPETPAIVFGTLLVALLTPSFLAVFVAATVSKPGDSYGVSPFTATRPLSSASLIAAKLKVTMMSALVTWLVVAAGVSLAVKWSGTWPMVAEWLGEGVDIFGMPRAGALWLLGFAALLASTWKQLVQSLYIAMTGREWLVRASIFVPLSLLAIAFPLGHWIVSSKRLLAAVLWNAVPWTLAALVCLKLFAAAWIAVRLQQRGLLRDRTLLLGAACWTAAVFALHGLLLWILPALLFRGYFLGLLAILAVPLARVAAAPLALAWNRHR